MLDHTITMQRTGGGPLALVVCCYESMNMYLSLRNDCCHTQQIAAAYTLLLLSPNICLACLRDMVSTISCLSVEALDPRPRKRV